MAGTSPSPREQEVGGAVPHSRHPHASALAPRSSPSSPFSLPRRLPFLRRTKLPSSALCPFRGPLLSPRRCPFRAALQASSIRPSEVSFHNFPPTSQQPPSPPAPTGSSGPGAARGARPHPSHPSPVSRAEARQAGVRCSGVRAAGSLRPQGLSSQTRRGRAEPGYSSRIRFGLTPSAATTEPQALPPSLRRRRRRSSGNL